MEIDELRKKIDNVDAKIIEFLNERARIVKEIGKKKRVENKKVYDPAREQEVYLKIKEKNKGPLNNELLINIYREIIASSRKIEQEGDLRVCYLGPIGTYSYFAAFEKFGATVDYVPLKGINAVFKEVDSKRADYGIVPVENSIEGGIRETLNLFVEYDNIKVCSEIIFPIHHSLMVNKRGEEIKKIYSKPPVFAQCREWLGRNFGNAEFVAVESSAEAARIVKEMANSAAIANARIAQLYGLEIISNNIEDNPKNVTRFFVLSHDYTHPSGNDKTIIMCYIKNRVGALHSILGPFKDYNINLTNIEALPTRKKAWDYGFYLDFEGHIEDDRVKNTINEVSKVCAEIKIIGSFPQNRDEFD